MELEQNQAEFRKLGLGVAAVSYDSAAILRDFAARKGIHFPLLSDPGKQVAEAYGVLPPVSPDRPDRPRYASRWWFFIGPDGKLVSRIVGAGHAGEISASAKQLLDGVKGNGAPPRPDELNGHVENISFVR